jgi:hypothetical protein
VIEHPRPLDGRSPPIAPTISSVETGLHTVGDLAGRHTIWAHCVPCGRAVQLDTSRLIAVYGPRLTIAELRRRLACSRCGERRQEIRIVFTLPTR